MATFRPMLAVVATDIHYPAYASAKLDGVRCVMQDGVALSRTLKPIPNAHIQAALAGLHGLDGELIVGEPGRVDVYTRTVKGVMSREGEPDFMFYVFDSFKHPDIPFSQRIHDLPGVLHNPHCTMLEHITVLNEEQLNNYERTTLAKGFEGVIIRSLDGRYKYGRSTAKEGYMLKLKRFADSEAVITGVYCLMQNMNAAEIDTLGLTKRSHHVGNMATTETLGALRVKDCVTGVEFGLGTGFTATERVEIWEQRHKLIGSLVKYKHFPVGAKDAPRFPVWLGFRDPIDL